MKIKTIFSTNRSKGEIVHDQEVPELNVIVLVVEYRFLVLLVCIKYALLVEQNHRNRVQLLQLDFDL
jgi:hypothetical protein